MVFPVLYKTGANKTDRRIYCTFNKDMVGKDAYENMDGKNRFLIFSTCMSSEKQKSKVDNKPLIHKIHKTRHYQSLFCF